MWVPLENVSAGGSNACVASSPGSIPGGSSVGARYAFWASCATVRPDAGAPRTRTDPSTSSRSSSGASSRCAAIRSSFSFRMRAAPSAAPALTTPPRLPRVPMPYGAAAVSPDWTRTFSIGTRQLVGQRLGDRRQVALALADDADLGRDGAARLDPDDGGVVAGSGDAGRLVELGAVRVRLDVGGHADPDDPSGRARLGLLASPPPRSRTPRARARACRAGRPTGRSARSPSCTAGRTPRACCGAGPRPGPARARGPPRRPCPRSPSCRSASARGTGRTGTCSSGRR